MYQSILSSVIKLTLAKQQVFLFRGKDNVEIGLSSVMSNNNEFGNFVQNLNVFYGLRHWNKH